jgi:hypothetical protein
MAIEASVSNPKFAPWHGQAGSELRILRDAGNHDSRVVFAPNLPSEARPG